ncbi:hypothetical protein [Taklimakanibacter lacteus]|uniref:hypothetical protein n=1 Tax=Taklimakanibacter lacteus TaxID=2268456 RepID=UPI000E66EF68
MRKSTKILAATAAIIAGLAVAPALFAQGSGNTGERTPMIENGIMGQGGMMGMMGRMSRMMESCNTMMQSMMNDRGSGAPNDRGIDTPRKPDSNG